MKNGKQSSQSEKGSSRILSLTVLFIALCGFSFYLGGMFCSERVKMEAKDVTTSTTTKAVASPMKPTVSPLQIKSVSFPECSSELQDYTPCTDPKVKQLNQLLLFLHKLNCCCYVVLFLEMEEVWCTSAKFLGASLSSGLRKERVFDSTTRRV